VFYPKLWYDTSTLENSLKRSKRSQWPLKIRGKSEKIQFIPKTPPSNTPSRIRVKPTRLTCQHQGLTWICVDLDLPKNWDLRVQNLQFFLQVDSQVPVGMPRLVACPTPTLVHLDACRSGIHVYGSKCTIVQP